MDHEILNRISKRLGQKLPADAAHEIMSPTNLRKYQAVKDTHRKAGVMALMYPKENEAHLLFIKRTSRIIQDKHAGQISFPGGKQDLTDKDLLACAQRETSEEVGVHHDQYKVLGSLSQLYIYISDFLVFPFLAYSDKELVFSPEEKEVERIIEYPLKQFLYFKNKKEKDLQVRDHILPNVPYFDVEGETLWGATSMILSELVVIFEELDIQENQLKYL